MPNSRPNWLVILLLTLGIVLAACSSGQPDETLQTTDGTNIVAYIGETPVTEAEWEQARAYATATLRLLGEPGAQLDQTAALESYIEDRLIAREAGEEGFSLPAGAVATEEERLLAVAGVPSSKLDEILAGVGLTQDAWRAELGRAVLAATYLEDVVLAEFSPAERADRRAAWLEDRKKAHQARILVEFEPIVGLRVGDLAPDFELPGLDGESLVLSDYRGQAVVLNFWATWCLPCRQEMPLFQSAYEQYRENGLVILATDVGEDARAIREYVDELGLTFQIGLDQSGELSRDYRVFGMPTTFFINREGVIDYVTAGAVRESDLDDILERILETGDGD